MPNGQLITGDEVKAFASWMRKQYGWFKAEQYLTEQSRQPFTYAIPVTNEIYLYWVGRGRPTESVTVTPTPQQRALEVESARPIVDAANKYYVPRINDTSVSTDDGYRSRANAFLNQLLYEGAIDEENYDRLFDGINERIRLFYEGYGTFNDLPFMDILQKPDYLEYFDYYVKNRKADIKEITAENERRIAAWKADRQSEYDLKVAQWQQDVAEKARTEKVRSAYREAKSQQRAMALMGAFSDEETPPAPTSPVGMPDPWGVFEQGIGELGTTGELSPVALAYFQGRGREIFSQFELEHPGARQAWLKTLQPIPREIPRMQRNLAQTQESLARSQQIVDRAMITNPELFDYGGGTGDLTPEELLIMSHQHDVTYGPTRLAGLEEAAQREKVAMSKRQRPTREGLLADWKTQFGFTGEEDPWKQYIKSAPFMSQFVNLPRRERGFYPSRSVSRARWTV